MSTHKYIDWICVLVLIATLALTVLFMNGERLGLRTTADEDLLTDDSPYFSASDRNADWNTDGATRIVLNGDTATVSGGGAYFYGGDVVISSAGRYVCSGALNNGSILVSADSGNKVWLLFDGVDIAREDDACLRIEQADKVFLTLAEGSKNRLRSGAQYRSEALEAGRDGALFSRDDLSINGSGSLSVSAGYRHGVAANDDLVIAGGSLSITAAEDAIHANDSLRIADAALTLRAGDSGLELNTPGGILYMGSGSLDVDSEDDGVHAAGDIVLDGGTLSIRSGDDALHADGGFLMGGGTLTVSDCYEGVEAAFMDIIGGTLEICCRDDGLNAVGEAPLAEGAEGEAPRQKGDIRISGGSVTVICESGREADGLDANGDILISGGELLLSMANSRGNCALDWGSENGGRCVISGGSVVGLDAGGMKEPPESGEGRYLVLCDLGTGRGSGAQLRLEDSEGRELLRLQAPCTFSCVLLSSPELRPGSYRLLIDGTVRQLELSEPVTVLGREK